MVEKDSPKSVKPRSDTSIALDDARAGDSAALSVLFTRHFPALRRWSSGRLPRWARTFVDTTDLVQDTLIRTFRRLDTFEAKREKALQAYLRAAVMNRVRDEIRRVKSAPAGLELSDEVADPSPTPFDLAVTGQMLERYRAALATLRPIDREAIVARVELGYSYEQVAAVIGKATPDAARLTVIRALAKLEAETEKVSGGK
jgi:RNA polymerase sigma factor (sigma-70 family)